jgi:uncharacterized protein (TIGR02246 family)
MNRILRGAFLILVISSVLGGCAGQQTETATTTDPAPARAAVDSLNQAFAAAVLGRDSNLVASFYAENGRFMPPNAPVSQGREAIRSAWAPYLADTTFALTIQSVEMIVSSSADMVVDVGTYAARFTTPQGLVQDTGKYVNVHQQMNGEWKIVTDIFNSDIPIPMP